MPNYLEYTLWLCFPHNGLSYLYKKHKSLFRTSEKVFFFKKQNHRTLVSSILSLKNLIFLLVSLYLVCFNHRSMFFFFKKNLVYYNSLLCIKANWICIHCVVSLCIFYQVATFKKRYPYLRRELCCVEENDQNLNSGKLKQDFTSEVVLTSTTTASDLGALVYSKWRELLI